MRIGVVRTVGSPCRCAESVSAGLQSLNHDPFLVDSEEVEVHIQELAEHCDFVIDHTDTYRGRGLYRRFVRLLLEDCGARVIGSSARSCFTADNKAAAKARLAESGIPVPPGLVIHSNSWELPDWLKPPLVLKPAFEHMSRGLCLAQTEQEARQACTRLLRSLRQPILVEAYIPGRELAVSLLGSPAGVQVLPALEWEIPKHGKGLLTEDFKLMDEDDERHRFLRADLDHHLDKELEELSQHAFRTLNLRDYARFDIRLSGGGSFYFLEANTTPSLEPMEALAVSAAWAGLDYAALVERLLTNARRRYEAAQQLGTDRVHIPLASGTVELDIAPGVPSPAPSSVDLAGLLDVKPGESVLDLGCGSGLLSIAAARLGAGRVLATDLSPQALQATRTNAVRNGVGDRIEIQGGAWYDALDNRSALSGAHESFDVIIATPPQTPGSRPFGPKYGGRDGAKHLQRIVCRSTEFLKPGGRLWIMAISLAHPAQLWSDLHEHFAEVSLVRKTDRLFTAAEYDSLEPGLFEYLCSLRSSGISDFVDAEQGQYFFHNLFIRAANPRRI